MSRGSRGEKRPSLRDLLFDRLGSRGHDRVHQISRGGRKAAGRLADSGHEQDPILGNRGQEAHLAPAAGGERPRGAIQQIIARHRRRPDPAAGPAQVPHPAQPAFGFCKPHPHVAPSGERSHRFQNRHYLSLFQHIPRLHKHLPHIRINRTVNGN